MKQCLIILITLLLLIHCSSSFFFDLGSLGGCSCQSSKCGPPAPVMGCQLLCPAAPAPSGCGQQYSAPIPQPSYSFNQMFNPFSPSQSSYQPSLSYNQAPPIPMAPLPPPPMRIPPPPLRVPPPPPPLYPSIPPPAPQIPSNAYQISPSSIYGRESHNPPNLQAPVRVSPILSQTSFNEQNNLLTNSFNRGNSYATSKSQLSLEPPNHQYVEEGPMNPNSVDLHQNFEDSFGNSDSEVHETTHHYEQNVEPSTTHAFEQAYDDLDSHPQVIEASKSNSYVLPKETFSAFADDAGSRPISSIAEIKTTEVNLTPVKPSDTNSWEEDNNYNWGNKLKPQTSAENPDDNLEYTTQSTTSSTEYILITQPPSDFQSFSNHNQPKTFEYELPTTKADIYSGPTTIAAIYTSTDSVQTDKGGNDNVGSDYEDDYETVDKIEQMSKTGPDPKGDDYFESDNSYEKKKERNINKKEVEELAVEEDEEKINILPEETSTIISTTIPEYTTTTATTENPTSSATIPSLFKKFKDLTTYSTTNHTKESGSLGKCNNEKLKDIMEKKMSRSASASKQAIFTTASRMFPDTTLNVICSCHSFSYIVVTSPIYCELRKSPLTCFAFVTP